MTIVGKYMGTDDDGAMVFEDVPTAYPPMLRKDIPAWSLHRLIEMALRYVLICGISFTFNEDAYEKVIGIIEHQIKEGYFPKKYLQEQAGSSREE